jgi:hypothetical protein
MARCSSSVTSRLLLNPAPPFHPSARLVRIPVREEQGDVPAGGRRGAPCRVAQSGPEMAGTPMCAVPQSLHVPNMSPTSLRVSYKPVKLIGSASSRRIPHAPTNRSFRHAAGDTARGDHRSRHRGRSPRLRRLLHAGDVGIRHDRAARRGGGAYDADHAWDRHPRYLEPQRGDHRDGRGDTARDLGRTLRARPRRQHPAARGRLARHAV